MSLAHVIAEVFTDTPLRGNQLAVFEDGPALSDDQMQRLAREMNLSETVFLLPAEARSPQGTGHRSRATRFSPIWSRGASLRTGLSVRGRLQRYMSLGE
jgi:trans-2,3-dihydro-3-hydroxyanthranilate isomerase